MDHQLPEVSLANEEWDFSGCPVGELFDCWVYEFAREYHRQHGSIPEAWRIWFPLGAGFPQTPYLSVSIPTPSEEVVVSEEDRKRFSEYFEKHPEVVSHSGDRFTINWRHSDRALVECFRRLLKNKRPTPSVRGKGRPPSLVTDLNCLGAFRLLKFEQLNSPQAEHYTFELLGFALFSGYSKWADACSKVEKIIKRFPEEMAKHTQLKPL